jgi:dynein regulatry complex protein 1
LENQKSQDANNQAEQKIKLEKEMQILEKCMEDMKAVYRLNEEKLEFNTKVLNERASVNEKTKKNLKTRANTYANIVREVKKEYHKELANFQMNNIKLTSEFKKFTKQFKELQKKFERFEKSDNNRLKEIKDMNEKEAIEIVEKIMHADKVIFTQQLDLPWKPPTDPVFRNLTLSQLGAQEQTSLQADSN